jgi:hypothetical protein
MSDEEPWSLRMIASDPDGYQPEILPEWISRAWSLFDGDPKIWGAALAWNEGLLLQARHPSFALFAYVSAIEGLSHSKIAQGRLNLSIRRKMKPGERVKTMLRLELDSDNAERIINTIYKSRNQTAHEASLHGFESSLGAWSAITLNYEEIEGSMTPVMHSNPDDKVHQFLSGVVQPLGLAAHALVSRVLNATPYVFARSARFFCCSAVLLDPYLVRNPAIARTQNPTQKAWLARKSVCVGETIASCQNQVSER